MAAGWVLKKGEERGWEWELELDNWWVSVSGGVSARMMAVVLD